VLSEDEDLSVWELLSLVEILNRFIIEAILLDFDRVQIWGLYFFEITWLFLVNKIDWDFFFKKKIKPAVEVVINVYLYLYRNANLFEIFNF